MLSQCILRSLMLQRARNAICIKYESSRMFSAKDGKTGQQQEESPRIQEFRKKLRERTPIGRLEELEEGKHPYQEKEPLERFPDDINPETGEIGGPRGPEPTRYGDWERKVVDDSEKNPKSKLPDPEASKTINPESERMKQFHEKLKLEPLQKLPPGMRYVDLMLAETDPESGELLPDTEKDPTKWGDWQNGGRVTDF